MWKIAEFEDRTPWPWAVGAVLSEFWLMQFGVFGGWYILYPGAAFAGVFAGLWWMRSRDERNNRNRPAGPIVR